MENDKINDKLSLVYRKTGKSEAGKLHQTCPNLQGNHIFFIDKYSIWYLANIYIISGTTI